MKRILKHLVGYIIGCIGTALVLIGAKTKRVFPIVSKTVTMPIVNKTVTMPIINYSLARARSAALVNKTVTLPIVNKTVTLNAFCNQLIGEGWVFPSASRLIRK